MSTNNELITDALRLLGVVAEGQSPSPEQAAHALGRLNRMIESWTEIDLGWFEQTLATADAPLPASTERGVISKLAQDLQATYPSSQSVAWVMDDSKNGYEVILRQAVVEQLKPADMSHLGGGNFGRFDITRGY